MRMTLTTRLETASVNTKDSISDITRSVRPLEPSVLSESAATRWAE